MNRTEIKQKIQTEMPTGYIDKIKTLLYNNGISVSRGRISEVCNPESDQWNNDVIEAALQMIEQEKEREENLINRAKSL